MSHLHQQAVNNNKNKQTNKQTTTAVEDITWPRGDTKFLFE